MVYSPIIIQEKLDLFSDHWSPKIIAQMNDYHFKLVKFKGDFANHKKGHHSVCFLNFRVNFVLAGRKPGAIQLRCGEIGFLSLG